MDSEEKHEHYRQILQEIIERYANMIPPTEEPESIAVCDRVHDHYLLMDVGWTGKERVHYVVVHLKLKDGKVLIEQDGIEYGIAADLIEAGVAPEEIVAAYLEPQSRSKLNAAA
jgi:hypothetical protein